MVEIFTGSGLGLERSSATVLGGAGTLGSAATGTADTGLYVNADTGNLVVETNGETLDGVGDSVELDAVVGQTYNSLALAGNSANGTTWASQGAQILNLTGTLNTTGSTVQRLGWDGSLVTYTWQASYLNTNGTTGAYVAKEGSGPDDSVTGVSTNGVVAWSWHDGSTGVTEFYGNANNTISTSTDLNGNTLSFSYTGNLLSKITTADGEYISLAYSGNNLAQLTTHLSGGTTLTRTYYTYDSQNRLTTVTNDLTPFDNSITDGNVYSTTFAYSGTSNLISSIKQSDGSEVDFTYDSSNRVSTITQWVNASTSRTTTMTYGSGSTTVTDPEGNQTVLSYDAKGELLSVAAPAVAGGEAQFQSYTYDANGDVLTQSAYANVGNAPSGSPITQLTSTYDQNGNVLTTVDLAGDETDYSEYNQFNEAQVKTVYTVPKQGSTAASGAENTFFVYDTKGNLRYTVSQAGDVTYNLVNSLGQTASTLQYTSAQYNTAGLTKSTPISLATMNSWQAGLTAAVYEAIERTDYTYDFRGNLASEITYSATDANGNGLLDPSSTSPLYTKTSFVYDQSGELLQKLVNTGGTAVITNNNLSQWNATNLTQSATTINGESAEKYTVQTAGQNAQITPTYMNISAGDTVTAMVTLQGVNAASATTFGIYGSVSGWGANLTTATIVSGPGTLTQNAAGLWTVSGLSTTGATVVEISRTFTAVEGAGLYLYPDYQNGNQVGNGVIVGNATVTQDHGAVTTYTYDGLGRLLTQTDPLGNATTTAYTNNSVGYTQTVTSANGLVETSGYDRAGELISDTDTGPGISATTTSYIYDADGNLRVSTDPAGVNTYYFYDSDGRKTGEVNGDGDLTEYRYDAAGRVVATVTYANPLSAAQLASLVPTSGVPSAVSLTAIQPLPSSNDTWNWTVYDAAGRVIQTINAVGAVTGYSYDGTGAVTQTTQYATQLNASQLTALMENTPGQNILYNAGFNSGSQTSISDTAGWSLWYNSSTSVGSLIYGSSQGQQYLQNTYTANSSSGQDSILSSQFSVLAGQTLNVQAGVYGSAQVASLSLAIWWVGSNGATIGSSAINLSGPQTFGTQMTGALLAPSGTVKAFLELYANAASSGSGTFSLIEPKVTIANATLAPVAVTANSGQDRTTRDFYNADGLLIGSLDARGYLTQVDYDDAGRKIDTVAYANQASPSLWATGTFAQLQASVGTSTSDQHIYFYYDNRGFLAETIDPAGDVTTYTYTASGSVATKTTGQSTVPGATVVLETTSYTYDSDGRILTETLGQGTAQAATTSYIYDAMGNVLVSTDPNGVSTHYFYDSESRLTGEVDGNGYLTEYKYDLDGRKVATVTYANAVSQALANGVASPLSLTAIQPLASANDNWNWTAYDAAGRAIQTIDADGAVTGYSYNALGNLTQTVHYSTLLTSTQLATLIENTPGQNVLSNPSLVTTSGWYLWYGSGGISAQPIFTGNYQNTNYIKTVFTSTAANQQAAIQSNNSAIAITPGQTINIQAGIEGVGPIANLQFLVWWFNSSGAVVAGTTIAAPAGTQSFNTQVSGTAVAPSGLGVVGASIALYADTSGTGTGYVSLEEPKVTIANATLVPVAVTQSSSDAYTNLSYDAAGRLLSTTDALGNTESYGLDAFGDRIQLTNKLGGVTTYAYDQGGNLTSETMSWTLANGTIDGTASTLANGNPESTSNLVTNTYAYDAFGNRTQQIEASNLTEARTTNYTYDSDKRLIQQKLVLTPVGAQTPVYATTTYSYDSNGNIVQTTDPNGNTTYNYYDVLNRKIAQVNALGVLTTYTYDNDSNIQSQTVYGTPGTTPQSNPTTLQSNGTSRVTLYAYDGDNRLLSTTVENVTTVDSVTTGWWNGASYSTYTGNLTTSQSVYDADGNVIESINGNGAKTYNYYDANGNKVAQVDADGYLTTYAYDQNGNVTTEHAYANAVNTQSVTLSTSTLVSALVTATGSANSLDRITQFTYDLNGNRLTESRLGVAAWTQGTGDAVTASTSTTSTITYTYNALNEVTAQKEATTDSTYYTYDSQGRLESTTTPTGLTTNEYYDGLNDVTRSVSSGANSNQRITTYTYGPGGRLASMTAAGVDAAETLLTTWYTYDLAGNLIQQSQVRNAADAASNIADMTTVYQYDALNRQVGQQSSYLAEPTPGSTTGATWQYGDLDGVIYNAYGEVAATTVTGGSTTTPTAIPTAIATSGTATRTTQFEYDNAGFLIASNSGDGTWKAYVPDGAGVATLTIQSLGATDLYGLVTSGTTGGLDTSTFNQAAAIALATGNGTNASFAAGIAISTTSGSPTVSYSGGTLAVGEVISGVGIPTGTTISSINATAGTATLSAAATATGVIALGTSITTNGTSSISYSGGALYVGEAISGSGVPSGDTIASVNATAGTATLASAATGSGSFIVGAPVGTAITTTINTNTVSYIGGTMWVGEVLTGAGIATGTTVTSVNTVNDTATLSANATASGTFTSGVEVTITNYDARNQQISTIQPDRQIDTSGDLYSISTSQWYDAFGDLVGQTDAKGNTTNYTYNTLGMQTSQIDPQVSIANDSGTTTQGDPTTYDYYDISGRLIATSDANGNLTTQVLAAGTGYNGSQALATTVYHPDGGVLHNSYDVYGDVLTQTDALGNVTTNKYDNSGNLIEVDHPVTATSTITLTNGSATATYSGGLLIAGTVLTGNEIPTGTKILSVNGNTLTLSAPVTAGGTISVNDQLIDYYGYDGTGEQVSQSNNVIISPVYTGQNVTFSNSNSTGSNTFTITLPTNPNVGSGSIVVTGINLSSGVTLTGSVSNGVLTLNYTDSGARAPNTFILTQNGTILYEGQETSGVSGAHGSQTLKTSGFVQSATWAPTTETTAYDAQGRVISTTDNLGNIISYAYQWETSQGTNGLANYGGWTKSTNDVSAGVTSSTTTDAFGHQIGETDDGGDVYTFNYNKAGELIGQSNTAMTVTLTNLSTSTNTVSYTGAAPWVGGTLTAAGLLASGTIVSTVNTANNTITLSQAPIANATTAQATFSQEQSSSSSTGVSTSGQNLAYTYFNTGKVATIKDLSAADPGIYNTTLESIFAYDLNGNRTLTNYSSIRSETYTYYGITVSVPTTTVLENATATYDALNRITQITDPGSSTRPSYTQTKTYDANGNIIENKTVHQNLSTTQTVTGPLTDDYWYAYDSMNRVAISQGSLSSASAAPGSFTVTAAVNTLQGVAAAVYDDGTQWSVIASANGLTGDTATTVLATGTVLRIPIAVEPGTSDTSTNTDVWARTNLTGGMALSYNADGEEMTSTTIDMAPNGSGGNFAQVTQNDYSYTADGELVGVSVGQSTVSAPNLVSSFATQAIYTRDALGRILTQISYDTNANDDASGLGTIGTSSMLGQAIDSTNYTYDADSHVLSEQTATIQYNVSTSAATDTVTSTTFGYGTANVSGSGYVQGLSYADGNVVSQSSITNVYSGTSTSGSPTSSTDVTTSNAYIWMGSAQQSQITSTYSGSSNGTTTSTFSYDNNDNVTQDVVTGVGAHTNYYTTTAAGMIMTSQEILSSGNQTSAPETFYYYFNDQLIGQIGNNGGTAIAQASGSTNYTSSIDDYSSGVTDQAMTDNGSGPFVGNNTGGIPTANFDENLNPITPTGNGSVAASNSYTVQNGQTLQSIAAAIYGDANLWYVIAGANGLTASSNLAAGTVLTLPNTVENAGNTASTFKPYNANAALGDVSPGAPVSTAQSGCGVAGEVLMLAVGAAIAAFVGPEVEAAIWGSANLGAAAAAAAEIAGDVVGAAVGSIASQGLGVALGVQSSINWSAVGLAALGGGISAGLTDVPGLAGGTGITGIAQAAARGVISSALTQGIGVATGLQSSFNWASVASAGVGAGVGAAAGQVLDLGPLNSSPNTDLSLGTPINTLVSGIAGGLAGAAAQSVLRGTDFGASLEATLPQAIGNTIGNAVAQGIAQSDNTAAQSRQAPQAGTLQNNGTADPTQGSGETASPAAVNQSGTASSDFDPIVVTAKAQSQPAADDGAQLYSISLSSCLNILGTKYVSKASLGNDAHKQMTIHVNSLNSSLHGPWFADVSSAPDGTNFYTGQSLFSSPGYPDIGNTDSRYIWEIKAAGQYYQAFNQVYDYSISTVPWSLANPFGSTTPIYIPGTSAPSFFSNNQLTLPGSYGAINYNFIAHGVITYTYNTFPNVCVVSVPSLIPALPGIVPSLLESPKLVPVI